MSRDLHFVAQQYVVIGVGVWAWVSSEDVTVTRISVDPCPSAVWLWLRIGGWFLVLFSGIDWNRAWWGQGRAVLWTTARAVNARRTVSYTCTCSHLVLQPNVALGLQSPWSQGGLFSLVASVRFLTFPRSPSGCLHPSVSLSQIRSSWMCCLLSQEGLP